MSLKSFVGVLALALWCGSVYFFVWEENIRASLLCFLVSYLFNGINDAMSDATENKDEQIQRRKSKNDEK